MWCWGAGETRINFKVKETSSNQNQRKKKVKEKKRESWKDDAIYRPAPEEQKSIFQKVVGSRIP